MSSSTETTPETQDAMKQLSRCNLHSGCHVDFGGKRCPVCKSEAEAFREKRYLQTEVVIARGENAKEVHKLQSRILQLEDRFQDELTCDVCGGDLDTLICSCGGPGCARCGGSGHAKKCDECGKAVGS